MLTLRESLKRKKLFEELNKKWETVELVFLGQKTYINRRTFKPNYYLIVESIELKNITGFDLMIITINPKSSTWNVATLGMKSIMSKFSSWFINEAHLRYMERYLKPVSSFLYHKC